MAKIFSIFDTAIKPGADNTSDIGSSLLQWKDLYIKGVSYLTTLGQSMTFSDNLVLTIGTGTGLKIGAATNNKISFFNSTPIVQPAATVDIATALIGLGLLASGTGHPITIADEVYGVGWDGSSQAPTKNAVYDKIQSMAAGVAGTYTPTLTNIANLDASTAYSCQYLQVGSVVTVSGRVDIDPTTTLTSCSLDISLPTASTFTAANQCGGTGCSPGIAAQVVAILANTVSAVAQMQWKAADVTNQATYFNFTYRVV